MSASRMIVPKGLPRLRIRSAASASVLVPRTCVVPVQYEYEPLQSGGWKHYYASRSLALQHDSSPSKRRLERIEQYNCTILAARIKELETLKLYELEAPSSGSIRIISLDRQAARNALSKKLLQELQEQVQIIHDEGPHGLTRALILASEVDSVFCAGADLKERQSMSAEEYVSAVEHPILSPN